MRLDGWMLSFWLGVLIAGCAFWVFAIKSVLRLAAWAGAL